MHFDYRNTTTEKVAILNVIARHLYMLGVPAQDAFLELHVAKPFSRLALASELEAQGWRKSRISGTYSHPAEKPVTAVRLPNEEFASTLELEFLTGAAHSDEIEYRNILTMMLKKISNP